MMWKGIAVKKIWQFIRQRQLNFTTRVIVSLLLVSVIPLLILQATATVMTNNVMTKKVEELLLSNLKQTAERNQYAMADYADILYQISIDDTIIHHVMRLTSDNDANAVAYYEVNTRLRNLIQSNQYIRTISIITTTGQQITYDVETASLIYNLWSDYKDLRAIAPYKNTIHKNGTVLTSTFPMKTGETTSYLFHMSKAMFDLNDIQKGPVAVIVISVYEEGLEAIINPDNEGTDSVTYVLDKENKIVASPVKDEIGQHIDPTIKPEEYVVKYQLLPSQALGSVRYTDPMMGWTYVNVYDLGDYFHDVQGVKRMMMVVGLMVSLLAVGVSSYFGKGLNRSIKKLIGGIEEVKKGNFDSQIRNNSGDDMDGIITYFNEMTSDIKGLIQEVELVSEKRHKAEIRSLEAQINPHFLYNTLDAINWLAIEKNEWEISKMLRHLGYILRYSVKNSNEKVTVNAIVEWLNKYLELYQFRVENSFDYEIQAKPSVMEYKLYKLLLQPFVENSLIHGFYGMENGGKLRMSIDVDKEKEILIIDIEDNGVGMDSERVEAFNRYKGNEEIGTSIGMFNAFNRMTYYYGDKVTWHIKSIEKVGTIVHIQLPAER